MEKLKFRTYVKDLDLSDFDGNLDSIIERLTFLKTIYGKHKELYIETLSGYESPTIQLGYVEEETEEAYQKRCLKETKRLEKEKREADKRKADKVAKEKQLYEKLKKKYGKEE